MAKEYSCSKANLIARDNPRTIHPCSRNPFTPANKIPDTVDSHGPRRRRRRRLSTHRIPYPKFTGAGFLAVTVRRQRNVESVK